MLVHASMFLTPFAISGYILGLFSRSQSCLVFRLDNKNHMDRTLVVLFAFFARFDLNQDTFSLAEAINGFIYVVVYVHL